MSGVRAWQSLRLVLESGVDYEVRTTVHPDLLPPESLLGMARELAGSETGWRQVLSS